MEVYRNIQDDQNTVPVATCSVLDGLDLVPECTQLGKM